MNVNKISIAKEILETKLRSPTSRMKLIPAWLWDAHKPKNNPLSARLPERDGRVEPQLEKFPPEGFAKTWITRFANHDRYVRTDPTYLLNFLRVSFFVALKKVSRFGTTGNLPHSHVGPLWQKLSRWKTKWQPGRNQDFDFSGQGLRKLEWTSTYVNIHKWGRNSQTHFGSTTDMDIFPLLELWACFQRAWWEHTGQCLWRGLRHWLYFPQVGMKLF